MASIAETAPRKRARKTPIPEISLYDKPYLNTEELAVYLGGDISVRTLETWRLDGTGPDYIPVTSKMVRYRRAAVDEWLLAKERKIRAAAA